MIEWLVGYVAAWLMGCWWGSREGSLSMEAWGEELARLAGEYRKLETAWGKILEANEELTAAWEELGRVAEELGLEVKRRAR